MIVALLLAASLFACTTGGAVNQADPSRAIESGSASLGALSPPPAESVQATSSAESAQATSAAESAQATSPVESAQATSAAESAQATDGPGSGNDGSRNAYARIPDIVARVSPSVVTVFTDQGQGSGVIMGRNGLIITNNHVAAAGGNLSVALVGAQDLVPATILGADPRVDLALIRIDQQGLPAATLEEREPRLGELAIAIGDPLGFENSVTVGVVSGLHRAIPGSAQQSQALVDLLQTDAAISPGNSGGALVGSEGTILGINVAFIPPSASAVSIGFAIPAATVEFAMPYLERGEPVALAWMGIYPVTLTAQLAQRFGLEATAGALVVQVQEGSPADEAGIREGDVITALGDRRVESAEDLLGALRAQRPGDRVDVTVDRNGESQTLQITLASPPTPPE
jgi:S1-C subfamily serine protease